MVIFSGGYHCFAPGGFLNAKLGIGVFRSPIFGIGRSALLLIRAEVPRDLPRARFRLEVHQMAGAQRSPLDVLASGGGSDGVNVTHWTELALPEPSATSAHLSYIYGEAIGSEEVELIQPS